MLRSVLLFVATTASLSLGQSAGAQTSVTTDPVGFTTVQCLANSDTFVSVPFTRPPEFTGAVQSVSGSTLTVSGSPWTANQFVYNGTNQRNRYYALIGPGGSGNTKEGHTFLVTANTQNELTLDTAQESLTGVPAGAQLVLIPYWTLASVFPPTDQNVSFTPTTSTRSFQTQILIPNYDAVGINPGYSATYYFINSGANVGWRKFGEDPTAERGDDPLAPDGYIVVRNQNGAPTRPLAAAGAVLMKKLTIPLATSATTQQDNSVAMIRPVTVPLSGTGLSPANGSFVATTSTRSFQDQLLLFNNAQAAINKAPSATYYYMNNGWRLFGDDPAVDHSADQIPAGSALRVRKARTANGQPALWTNAPTY